MKKFLVIYDLVGTNETSRDYQLLISKIKSYPWWGKIQKSGWIIKTGQDAATVRNQLYAVMDSNDRLFVAALTGESAWTTVLCDEAALKLALTTS